MGMFGGGSVNRVAIGRAVGGQMGRVNHLCQVSWSSSMRVSLMTSLSDWGLHRRIAYEISGLSPPLKVLTNAFLSPTTYSIS